MASLRKTSAVYGPAKPKDDAEGSTVTTSATATSTVDGASDEFEFGGPLGVTTLMVGFPLLMWYMWIGATYYDGHLPMPSAGQSWSDFVVHLVRLVYDGAFPTAKAWLVYWSFFLTEAVMYCYLPGVSGYGRPLHHEGGKKLPYYCSAYTSFYATMILAALLHWSGIFPLSTIVDEFGSLMSVAILSGFLNSALVYIHAFAAGRTHRLSGNAVYDFFVGAELNPRVGILDLKMFYEVRIPWYILFFISCSVAVKQYEQYGSVSPEVIFLVGAHYLYANACAKGEELIITSWDMYYEKLGFLLTFWNMAGVPFTYCHCALYFARKNPTDSPWHGLSFGILCFLYLFFYWVWDSANGQKNSFRRMQDGHFFRRNTFPQVPWQSVKNPKTIETEAGDRIMVDGWFAIVRKPNYVPDMFFAFSWGLVTGLHSPFPWFYPVFFMAMIIHRTHRDVSKCRRKYGEAWRRYEKQVPYLFIPGDVSNF